MNNFYTILQHESSFENNQQIIQEPFVLDISGQDAEIKIERKDTEEVEDEPDEDVEEHLVEYLEADVEHVEESPEENDSNTAYFVEMIDDDIDEQNETSMEIIRQNTVKLSHKKKFKVSSENEERWFCDVCGASYKVSQC